ncbi:class I SAM-dependent methyltransferase [Reichenbachiella sp.]|uniref:class I SAM-dependent methyltransferase n=1 Tax=Reichenbachiella sp. TaxID=2184521 RepID=UPI003BB0E240
MGTDLVKSKIKIHNQTQLDYYSQKIKRTMKPVNSNYVNRHIDEFIKVSQIRRDQNVIDVGCGMGKFTLPLLKKGYKLTGLDLSPFLLQQLLLHNDNQFNVELICSDILEVPSEYNLKFDKVIGFFALHHFHHLHTYFQAMSRILKPGGEIVFIEPNAYNPLYYIQILFSPTMSWKGDKGVFDMKRKNFKKAAEYAKLNDLEIYKYGFFPPFVVNTSIGKLLEKLIEKLRIFKFFSAFQIIKVKKP